MPLTAILKPRSVRLSGDMKAVKTPRKLTAFLSVVADAESGGTIKWFRGDFFEYRWESYLYPDRANSTPERRATILSVSAKSKSELTARIQKLLSEAPDELNIAVHSDPLSAAENCRDLLALAAQREGGLH